MTFPEVIDEDAMSTDPTIHDVLIAIDRLAEKQDATRADVKQVMVYVTGNGKPQDGLLWRVTALGAQSMELASELAQLRRAGHGGLQRLMWDATSRVLTNIATAVVIVLMAWTVAGAMVAAGIPVPKP